MAHGVSHSLPGRPPLRATVALGGYAVLLYCVAVTLCLWPKLALATGYARIMTVAQYNAMNTALVSAQRSLAAQAIAAASSPVSVAVRVVTGPIGWAAIGVSAGLALAQLYYSQQQVADIQRATETPGVWDIPDYLEPVGSSVYSCALTPSAAGCGSGFDYVIHIPLAPNVFTCPTPPSGWLNGGAIDPTANPITCKQVHPVANTSSAPTQTAATPGTQQQVADYLGNLPAGDPNSVPANQDPLGTNVSPTPADTVTTQTVDPTQAQTTVVPSTQVPSGSVMVDPDATPPAGTQTQTTTQQDTTTTTNTTTNPDGSTTTEEDSTAIIDCTVGDHELRTFGQILQDHVTTWQGSGIAGQLALLQNLTWPTALPTLSFSSTALSGNTFSVNFNEWAAMFLALRTLVIAGAGFVAYRLIFTGR